MIKTGDRSLETSGFVPVASLISVTKAVVVSYIFLIAAFAVLALVYTYTSMPQRYLEPAVDAISAVSLVGAGFLASRSIRSFGWLHGALAGIISTVIRLLLSLAVFDGYVPTESPVMLMAIGVICSTLGGILGVNLFRGGNKRRKK